MDKRTQNIETLVDQYIGYWSNADIDGLMSMYSTEMKYHDIPSGEIIDYRELHQFIVDTFARLQNYRIKLNLYTLIGYRFLSDTGLVRTLFFI